MAKTELTKLIESAVFKHFFLNKSERCGLEVAVFRGRVDFMCYNKKDIFTCVEIKISKSDFKSKSGHNFVGHKNYYAMPEELYEQVKDDIPTHVGVFVLDKEVC